MAESGMLEFNQVSVKHKSEGLLLSAIAHSSSILGKIDRMLLSSIVGTQTRGFAGGGASLESVGIRSGLGVTSRWAIGWGELASSKLRCFFRPPRLDRYGLQIPSAFMLSNTSQESEFLVADFLSDFKDEDV